VPIQWLNKSRCRIYSEILRFTGGHIHDRRALATYQDSRWDYPQKIM